MHEVLSIVHGTAWRVKSWLLYILWLGARVTSVMENYYNTIIQLGRICHVSWTLTIVVSQSNIYGQQLKCCFCYTSEDNSFLKSQTFTVERKLLPFSPLIFATWEVNKPLQSLTIWGCSLHVLHVTSSLKFSFPEWCSLWGLIWSIRFLCSPCCLVAPSRCRCAGFIFYP